LRRSLFLFVRLPATEETAENIPQIFQILTNEFIHQVGLRTVYRSRDLKRNGAEPGLIRWLEILLKRAKELSADLFVKCKLGFEAQLPAESDRARRRKPNIR